SCPPRSTGARPRAGGRPSRPPWCAAPTASATGSATSSSTPGRRPADICSSGWGGGPRASTSARSSCWTSRAALPKRRLAADGGAAGRRLISPPARTAHMIFKTDDLRIAGLRPLIPPAILMEELPIGEKSSETVARGREQIAAVLHGEDDRLLVVVGPCSVHDPEAALDYAHRLRAAADRHARDLLIVMRVYFEKPRTIVGWKGLINDPHLDESFAINEGLRRARRLLLAVAELGLPAGSEFLDPISPQFIADLVSWGAIGARTS